MKVEVTIRREDEHWWVAYAIFPDGEEIVFGSIFDPTDDVEVRAMFIELANRAFVKTVKCERKLFVTPVKEQDNECQ